MAAGEVESSMHFWELPLRGAAGMGKQKQHAAAVALLHDSSLCFALSKGGVREASFMTGGAPAA